MSSLNDMVEVFIETNWEWILGPIDCLFWCSLWERGAFISLIIQGDVAFSIWMSFYDIGALGIVTSHIMWVSNE